MGRLYKCSVCGHIIAENAARCVGCGHTWCGRALYRKPRGGCAGATSTRFHNSVIE
jgi:hypothetical protein